MRNGDRPAVTLQHVARAAGVSRATASRVLSGAGPWSADARDRVRTAAARLGYVADPVARALVRGEGTRVVVAVTGADETVLDDPYVARVVAATARVCGADGLGASARWVPRRSPGEPLAELARDRSVGGVVLVNTTREQLDAVPRALRGRIASIGIGAPGVPSVDVDNGGGTGAAVEHLIRSGRRRIAMVTGPPWLPCTGRPVASYRRAVADAGLPERTVRGDFTAAAGRAGADEALARWPDTDALVVCCDAAALGALTVLRRRGLDVPGDVAVTGFDDILAAAHSGPALTTASHPVERIAAAAARAALHAAAAEEELFPSALVVRESA